MMVCLSLNCPVLRRDLLWMQPVPLRVYLISYLIFEIFCYNFNFDNCQTKYNIRNEDAI